MGKTWTLEETKLAVIISSTTGDGEQPEVMRIHTLYILTDTIFQNVIKFWRKLRPKSLSNCHLSKVHYALLGLGDTNYNQFCAAPRAIHRRLQELGAHCLLPPAWADDGTGLEAVVEPWLDQLWLALDRAKTGAQNGVISNGMSSEKSEGFEENNNVLKEGLSAVTMTGSTTTVTLPACPERYMLLTFQEDSNSSLDSSLNLPLAPLPSSAGPLRPATLVNCTRLTKDQAPKHYYEAVLAVEGSFDYRAGDTVAVVCPNQEQELQKLCQRMQLSDKWHLPCQLSLDPDTRKKKASLPAWLPTTASLDLLFRHHLDIRAVPKKPLVRSLVDYTNAEEDRSLLARLSSREGAAEYLATVREAQLSLLDLLALVPSCLPPVSLLIEHLPRLLPRPYSLSSSPDSSTQGHLSFVFTLVDNPRPGLATSFLASASPNSTVHLYLRTGTSFFPPDNLQDGLVMVAAGSGIGPFLGFLRERKAKMEKGGDSGPCWLFFGCRSKEYDFIYQAFLQEMVDSKVITKLVVAFSREEVGPGYVQDAMVEHRTDLTRLLLDEGARLYVCGDAKGMARGVQAKLEEILVAERGLEMAESADLVKKLRQEKRYLEDVWT